MASNAAAFIPCFISRQRLRPAWHTFSMNRIGNYDITGPTSAIKPFSFPVAEQDPVAVLNPSSALAASTVFRASLCPA